MPWTLSDKLGLAVLVVLAACLTMALLK